MIRPSFLIRVKALCRRRRELNRLMPLAASTFELFLCTSRKETGSGEK